MTDSPLSSSPAGAPRGIGGWLLVPVAGLLLTIGLGIYAISDVVISPEMLSVALTYRLSLAVEFVGTLLFWTLLPAITCVLLLLRNRRFPAAFVGTNVLLTVFNLLDPFIFAIDYGFSPGALPYAAIPAVWFLGWSWYMHKSVRVKNTFGR